MISVYKQAALGFVMTVRDGHPLVAICIKIVLFCI